MANTVADQCVYVAHGVDRSAKVSTMVNKRISWAAKPQQFGQKKNSVQNGERTGFSSLPTEERWLGHWMASSRQASRKRGRQRKLTYEMSLSWHFKRPGWVRCPGMGFESYCIFEWLDWQNRSQNFGTLQDINLHLLTRDQHPLPIPPQLQLLTISIAMLRQQVLSFPRVPTHQERMLDVIERSHHSIQAFNPRTRSLKTFPWYILIRWRSPEAFTTHSCIGPWRTQYASHPTNGATIARTTISSILPVSVDCSSHRVKYSVTLKRPSTYPSMGGTEGSG